MKAPHWGWVAACSEVVRQKRPGCEHAKVAIERVDAILNFKLSRKFSGYRHRPLLSLLSSTFAQLI